MRRWANVGSSLPSKLAWIDPALRNRDDTLENVQGHEPRRPSHANSGNSQSLYDDGLGPGIDGVLLPGEDMCRTLRIFTCQKLEEAPISDNHIPRQINASN